MQFVRKGCSGWSLAAAIALAVPASASAQQPTEVGRGAIVFVEEDDGSLTPYRRIDSPGEGDGRARLQPVDESAIPQSGEPTAYLVVPRSAVVTPAVATEVDDIEVVETEVRAGKADGDAYGYAEPPPPPVVETQVERPTVRPRLGVMALGGGMLHDVEGWLVGGALQLGVQIGDWFSIYYQPTALYAGLDAPGGERDDAFTLWNSLLFELTLFDWVSVAAGPSADIFAECEQNAACADDEVYFGAHGRVSLNLGAPTEMGRHAIQLSFEFHPTWYDFEGDGEDTMSYAMLGGLGIQMY